MSPVRRTVQAFHGRPLFRERTWWIFIIGPLALIIWVLDGPWQRYLDGKDVDGPDWLTAEIRILDGNGPDGKPYFEYQPCAHRSLTNETTWSARLEIRRGNGAVVWLPGAKGNGSYDQFCTMNMRTWGWMFDGADVPVPNREYRFCVFYDAVTPSGVHQKTEHYCSQWVQP